MNFKALFFSTTSSPVGGVETWLDRCCQHLQNNGIEPVVGLAKGQKANNPQDFKRYYPHWNTLEVDGRGLNSEGRIRAIQRCIRKVQPSVVLPMNLVEANEAVVRRKAAGDNLRLVVHAQGNLPAMLADLAHYRFGIDHAACPGKLTKRFLLGQGFEESRVSHIPNGASPKARSRASRLPGSPIRIGYVGRFTRGDKRATDLIPLYDALSELGIHFQLTIVGKGPAEKELKSALAEKPNVQMPGPMSNSQLYEELYPNLDVLVLCSSSEAFGIVLVEAMMNGVVPVSSRYLGFYSEHLVTEEQTGLSFEVGDMAAAAAQIARLQSDHSLWQRLSEKSQQFALENYLWPRSLQRWQDLLCRVVDSPAQKVQQPQKSASGKRSGGGRLDRLGVPPSIVDGLRRARRFCFGPAVEPGGEEWPLFRRCYESSFLEQITDDLRQLDRQSEFACENRVSS